MKVESYLFFDGRCEEAVEFYRKALGAKVQNLVRYKEGPEPPKEGYAEKIMHASFLIGDTRVMAADDCQGKPAFDGFSQCIVTPDEPKARECFAALADGGKVLMPLQKTFYSPCFGMLTDRFGIMWMILTEEAHGPA